MVFVLPCFTVHVCRCHHGACVVLSWCLCVVTLQGALDVFRSVIKKEGVLALWSGFLPYYSRLGPHTVITFIVLEEMNMAYQKHFKKH